MQSDRSTSTSARPARPEITLATTTSVRDSGLLEMIVPRFESETRYRVKTVAVGSGKALELGERGEADVLLVHAPDAEKAFMLAGNGAERRLVMHNRFVVVGPSDDPAKIRDAASVVDALRVIAASKATFVSRGDNSGTDQFEKRLWKQAGVAPGGESWYVETDQGMGATLAVASERRAYAISDRATYLASRDRLHDLDVLVGGPRDLLNVYHVITVNPSKSDTVNAEGARAFADFVVSEDTQKVIGQFGRNRYGEQLFSPDAGKSDDEGSLDRAA